MIRTAQSVLPEVDLYNGKPQVLTFRDGAGDHFVRRSRR
jgi:hypothetical protein